MKILLDECVTKHLKPHLAEHEVFTVHEMNWSGIKNGRLMAFCVEQSFDILLTIDKNLQYQQNLYQYPISIVVLNSFSSKVEELTIFLPILNERLGSFEKHKAYLLDR
jgi:predicted nuclease of predicted toxin-antitoxin system